MGDKARLDRIDELINNSSLGTEEAKLIQSFTDPAIAAVIGEPAADEQAASETPDALTQPARSARPGCVHDGKVGSGTVCLIRPPAVETFRLSSLSITPPLGLAYVAGAVERAGHRVEIVDAVAEAPERHTRYFRGYLVGLTAEQIAARVPADSKVVGISVLFTHEWPAITQLIEAIKEHRPGLPVVVGGEHVTSMPELCLLTSKADYLVLGEGEETMVELVDALDRGAPMAEMLGIGYREGNDVVVNARRARALAVDDIAWPAWNLIDLDTYHEHRWMGGMWSHNKSVPILATRGCPYQCTYCSAPNMWTPRWIPRDPKQVVDEIQYYYDNHGARNFPFQDLTAIIQRQWIIDFCNELLSRGLEITWQMPTGTRSEAIDAEVAGLLKRTGMISMAYAPESGSEKTRQLIKKKMKSDRMYESMQAAVDAELNVMVFMVIGFPHDKPEHLKENFEFFDKIAEIGINDVEIYVYKALPGTELFESLYDGGQIRLDVKYFRHLLSSASLWATAPYAGLRGWELTRWRFRLMRHFYKRQRSLVGPARLGTTVAQALRSLRNKDEADTIKLHSALRNGIISFIATLKVKIRPGGWMPRRRETAFFSEWDGIYREIRRRNLETGAAVESPVDTTALRERDIKNDLESAHGTRRRIPVTIQADPLLTSHLHIHC